MENEVTENVEAVEDIETVETVQDGENIENGETTETVQEVEMTYDLETFETYCGVADLTIHEVSACLTYEQNEQLDLIGDVSIISLNIIIAIALGYIAVRGLFDPWRI